MKLLWPQLNFISLPAGGRRRIVDIIAVGAAPVLIVSPRVPAEAGKEMGPPDMSRTVRLVSNYVPRMPRWLKEHTVATGSGAAIVRGISDNEENEGNGGEGDAFWGGGGGFTWSLFSQLTKCHRPKGQKSPAGRQCGSIPHSITLCLKRDAFFCSFFVLEMLRIHTNVLICTLVLLLLQILYCYHCCNS